MKFLDLFPNPWWQDTVAMLISFAVALAFLRLNDLVARRGWLPEYVTRKLVHIGTGPLFLLCWPLYSTAWPGRWFAAAVPASLTLLFALIGAGAMQKDDFVAAMSRSGDRRELLRGPLMYGVVFVVATLAFWRNSPVGVIVLMLLCGGDGLADIVGRRLGRVKLPGHRNKSWFGSAGFFVGGVALSLLFLTLFTRLGYLSAPIQSAWQPVLLTGLIAMLVEAYTPRMSITSPRPSSPGPSSGCGSSRSSCGASRSGAERVVMADLPTLAQHDDNPIFTIKRVVQETGIAPATLRAWERRYGLLTPERTEGGYRLYSERDIVILRWLKGQVDAGLSISSAAALLEIQRQKLQARGAQTPQPATTIAAAHAPRAPQAIRGDLVQTLLAFQEPNVLLDEAFSLYTIDTVLDEVISPALAAIGEGWHQGAVSVEQEHFATTFLRHRLSLLFHRDGQPLTGRLALTGSAPGEWHDIGILHVSIALRRHGWRVIFLGQNVPLDHLLPTIELLQPDLVCLSASTPATAESLCQLAQAFTALFPARPPLALGGQGFSQQPDLRPPCPGAHIVNTPQELLALFSQ